MVLIVLAIAAWKKGWGGLALLPLFLELVGWFRVTTMRAFGQTVSLVSVIFIDAIAFGTLILMVIFPRQKSISEQEEKHQRCA